ncbi:MAG: ABC transporter substrate-binding protein, partial [Erysipelotrichaceae bacterium]|nr:ABC transporter substrate-binding protein [Erysipelotrichaceae bacterium]
MKKILAALLVVLLSACSNPTTSTADEDAVHIGVLQLMEHEALNNTYDGFVAALKEKGYEEGKNLVLSFENPNNDKSALATMAQKLVNEENDLILAIGTAAAQSLQQETETIPILGSAITDYLDVGLVESNDMPGKNISGSSDYCDMATQMDLVEMIVPQAKTIGLLYTSSEENSIIQAQQ